MEIAFTKDELEAKSYAELRSIAKSVGIKANMKTSRLLKALQDYAETIQKDAGLPVRAKSKAVQEKAKTDSPAPSSSSGNRRASLGPATPLSASRRIRTPSSAKRRPVLHRLRTPPSKSSSPAVRTPYSGRKRARSPEEGQTPVEKRSKVNAQGDAKKSQTPTHVTKAPVESPGTKQIIDSVDGSLSREEMKEQILDALNKNVQEKMDNQPSQIPRFVTFAERKKKEAATITPGQQRWQKVHAKQFNLMDSIDTYLEKKKKRAEMVSGSAQKSVTKSKTGQTPTTEKSQSKASAALFKTPVEKATKFVPQVTSISKVNYNFNASKTTPGAVRSSATKRRSPRLLQTNTSENIKLQPKKTGGTQRGLTPGRQESAVIKSDTASKPKAHTPYKFNATLNQSSNQSINKKPKFDLAASLAKPLSWKPHTGKLQPYTGDGPATHKKDVKAVKLTTKEQRRQQAKKAQSQRRHSSQMKKRGIKA